MSILLNCLRHHVLMFGSITKPQETSTVAFCENGCWRFIVMCFTRLLPLADDCPKSLPNIVGTMGCSAPSVRCHHQDVPRHWLVERSSLKSVAQHFDTRSPRAMFQQVSLPQLRTWTTDLTSREGMAQMMLGDLAACTVPIMSLSRLYNKAVSCR